MSPGAAQNGAALGQPGINVFNLVSMPFLDHLLETRYEEAHQRSLENPEEFWGQLGKSLIHWDKPFEKVLDNRQEPFTKW